jgi:hypothetical protein
MLANDGGRRDPTSGAPQIGDKVEKTWLSALYHQGEMI